MGIDYDTAKRWEAEAQPWGVQMNGKVWKKFVEFFRTEKGYEDWTEDEIEFSRNDDDTTEFMVWLVNKLEEKKVMELDGHDFFFIESAMVQYIDYLKNGDEEEQKDSEEAQRILDKVYRIAYKDKKWS